MSEYRFSQIDRLVEAAQGGGLDAHQGRDIANWPLDRLWELIAGADFLRRQAFGNAIRLCSIVNAKSGKCGQDCAFCAQSGHHHAEVDTYAMISAAKIIEVARSARDFGASEFSIVTSGKGLSGDDLEIAAKAIAGIGEVPGLSPCASVGVLDPAALSKLKKAGLTRFHHNLETAAGHYDAICTTREHDENVRTVKDAAAMGLQVCCGGIFGMGESRAQRVELALELREMGIANVPMNFLHPIPGTPLENQPRLSPLECLRIIALFRFMLPKAQIILCGGRELNLGQFQSSAFAAGASGMMIGNYLTTLGQPPEQDLQMLAQAGLVPKGDLP